MSGRSRADPAPIRSDPHPSPLLALLHACYDLIWIVGIVLGSPWWLSRSAWDAEFREGVRRRLSFGMPPRPAPGHAPRIVVHGVSVGEVMASRSVVRGLLERLPDHEVVISTTTSTGAAIARRVFPDLEVAPFPVDVSFLVQRFLRHTAPVCVVLMELEIWPNFLRCCNRAGVPMAVVNGRITAASHRRYRRFRSTLPQFDRVSLFCTQNERYGERFADLAGGDERVVVTGNVKFDGLRTGPVDRAGLDRELRELVRVDPRQPVVLAGSTHEPEEVAFVRAARAGAPDARLVVVPRHPGRAREVVRALEGLGAPAELLTELRASGRGADPRRPLVVDTIGELEQLYGLAELVFVGGSLIAHGGQNMLEPAAQGVAVVYGPHVDNFIQEAALLEEAGAACRVADEDDLAAALRRLLRDRRARAAMARAGIEAVLGQRGATELTLAALVGRCLRG